MLSILLFIVGLLSRQGLEFLADNKEAQVRGLQASVEATDSELGGLLEQLASLEPQADPEEVRGIVCYSHRLVLVKTLRVLASRWERCSCPEMPRTTDIPWQVVSDLENIVAAVSAAKESLAQYNSWMTLFDLPEDDGSQLLLAEKEANDRYEVGSPFIEFAMSCSHA